MVCSLHALYELRLAREVEVVTPCSGACNHNGLAVEAEGAGFGFQVVVVEWLGWTFTPGSTWTKVVFEVLGSPKGKKERKKKKEKWVGAIFFKN